MKTYLGMERAKVNMQTNAHKFGMVSYNKNEARKVVKPLCVCMLKDRETHIFCGVKKVT